MDNKYCTNCGVECMQSMRTCYECGNEDFSDTPVTIKPKTSSLSAEQPVASNPQKPMPWETSSAGKPPLVGVRGWLLFFVIIIVFISPIYAGYEIKNLVELIADPKFPSGVLKNWMVAIACAAALLVLYGVYAGVQLWSVKSGAVKTAKTYLVVAAVLPWVICLIFLQFLTGPEIFKNMGGEVIGGMIFSGIWYWYLASSRRVKDTYNL